MITIDITEKINVIKAQDPEGASRLEKLLGKQDALKEGNVYKEKFTDRQFNLVFFPLLDAAYERAQILEAISPEGDTVANLAEKVGFEKQEVFRHLKEMMRKNLVEIADHSGREAIFRKK